MPPSHRIPLLATRIASHIRAANLAEGAPMTERALAQQFDISRTPVKQALLLLAGQGLVRPQGRGGFVVADHAATTGPPPAIQLRDGEEEEYLQVARDHLAHRLPARITENGLIRRYGLTRQRIVHILLRAAQEGWAERLPGHGWRLLPVVASADAYAKAYRYRILIEPAGILEPGFLPDAPALLACRAQHTELIGSDPSLLATAGMFYTANAFHEVVMRCSNNPFYIEGLTRLSRLRRLMEYGKSIDRDAWMARCAQHIEMIDLILAGKRRQAAARLRRHLEEGAASKTEASA